MSNIIDYAGLFPPAKLDMNTTVANYASYQSSDDSWMLGRLIVPVARLEEFATCAADVLPRHARDEPWRVSALTAPAEDDSALDRDLDLIAAFNETHADAANGSVMIDAMELKAGSAAAIDAALELIQDDVIPFFEVPLGADPRGLITALAGTEAGAKARTGGVTPDLFPAADSLARFIHCCALADVPFKATAGLHHPFSHASRSVPGAREYGFANLFVGAAMSYLEMMDEPQLAELLCDQRPEQFEFSNNLIHCRGMNLSLEQIQRARNDFAVSYGSCSFVEPNNELRNLKLI